MPPNLAAYQKAAQSIYVPQQKAEAASLATQEKTAINTLESSKGQVATDYQSAIDNLNSTLKGNIAKINQLYTERLGGNFSGLQGNDIGGAVSTALKQQSAIESTRANKLAAISTAENNAKLTYNTDIANLGSKYNALKAKYAQDAYGNAVKQYETDQYRQESLQMRQEALNISAERAATSAAKSSAPSAAATKLGFAQQFGSKLNSMTGSDGYVSPKTYNQLKRAWTAQGYSSTSFDSQFGNYVHPGQKGYNVATAAELNAAQGS